MLFENELLIIHKSLTAKHFCYSYPLAKAAKRKRSIVIAIQHSQLIS